MNEKEAEELTRWKYHTKKTLHILIARDMTKSDLQKAARLSWGSIAKLNKGENVGTDLLLRICNALDCELSDIMEIERESNKIVK